MSISELEPMTAAEKTAFDAQTYAELLRDMADVVEEHPEITVGLDLAQICVATLDVIDARHDAEGEAAYDAWLDEIGEGDATPGGDD